MRENNQSTFDTQRLFENLKESHVCRMTSKYPFRGDITPWLLLLIYPCIVVGSGKDIAGQHVARLQNHALPILLIPVLYGLSWYT